MRVQSPARASHRHRFFSPPRHQARRRSAAKGRRGSLLAELTMATVLLMIAMTLTVKLLGWVALERRSAERRQRAIIEVANVMERITAYPFEEVNSTLARGITLSETAHGLLSGSELTCDVTENAPAAGRSVKRIAVVLRWRGSSGEWAAPVRLTSWIERGRKSS
jgi:hypothetical protein